MSLKVVGLCGGSGSGKSTVCSVFEQHGVPTIDTDAIYHELTSHDSECLRELVLAFGDEIVRDGALHRPTLAAIVFAKNADKSLRDKLNKITHKHVLDEVRRRLAELESLGALLTVVDVPLLFESGFDKECDAVIAVVADTDVRVERIIARDSITREHALARISAQYANEWLVAHADHVIDNNTTTDELAKQICEIINKILI